MLDLSQQRIAITGSAGFIGFHLTQTLLAQGMEIHSLDAVNDYYDVTLKKSRLAILDKHKNHHFHKGQLENPQHIEAFFTAAKPDIVIHLAAQAGVRYSITHPQSYIDSNLVGFQNILDAAQKASVKHFVYASSSSVYGSNGKIPFSESDAVEHPLSLYAATKKANELMAHSYSSIFSLPTTGLRFFTVYGPWSRPDMATLKFTHAIADGTPIDVYNHGNMRRDFTYIDDIISGILSAARKPASINPNWDPLRADPATSRSPWKVYNLGNNKPVKLMDLIHIIESGLGQKAKMNMLDLQPGEVQDTCADITRAQTDLGFAPTTTIEDGMESFLRWYRDYYRA